MACSCYTNLELKKRADNNTIISLHDRVVVNPSSLLQCLVKITAFKRYSFIEFKSRKQKDTVLIKNIHTYIFTGTNKNLICCSQVKF